MTKLAVVYVLVNETKMAGTLSFKPNTTPSYF